MDNLYMDEDEFEQYLDDKLESSINTAVMYVSARDVSSAVGCSPKEAGKLLERHRTCSDQFETEPWNNSRQKNRKWIVRKQ